MTENIDPDPLPPPPIMEEEYEAMSGVVMSKKAKKYNERFLFIGTLEIALGSFLCLFGVVACAVTVVYYKSVNIGANAGICGAGLFLLASGGLKKSKYRSQCVMITNLSMSFVSALLTGAVAGLCIWQLVIHTGPKTPWLPGTVAVICIIIMIICIVHFICYYAGASVSYEPIKAVMYTNVRTGDQFIEYEDKKEKKKREKRRAKSFNAGDTRLGTNRRDERGIPMAPIVRSAPRLFKVRDMAGQTRNITLAAYPVREKGRRHNNRFVSFGIAQIVLGVLAFPVGIYTTIVPSTWAQCVWCSYLETCAVPIWCGGVLVASGVAGIIKSTKRSERLDCLSIATSILSSILMPLLFTTSFLIAWHLTFGVKTILHGWICVVSIAALVTCIFNVFAIRRSRYCIQPTIGVMYRDSNTGEQYVCTEDGGRLQGQFLFAEESLDGESPPLVYQNIPESSTDSDSDDCGDDVVNQSSHTTVSSQTLRRSEGNLTDTLTRRTIRNALSITRETRYQGAGVNDDKLAKPDLPKQGRGLFYRALSKAVSDQQPGDVASVLPSAPTREDLEA